MYLERWPALSLAIHGHEMASNPLVVGITDGYLLAKRRIAVIGQETHGWIGQFNHTPNREFIELLQRQYLGFAMGTRYRSTPFWRFAHRLMAAISPETPLTDMAWSNLNPVDIGDRRPWEIEERLHPLGIIRRELEILKPDVAVFLTGPTYDGVLDGQFLGLQRVPVQDLEIRKFCLLKHSSLPPVCFRIYHPAYLQKSRQFEETLSLLAACILQPPPCPSVSSLRDC